MRSGRGCKIRLRKVIEGDKGYEWIRYYILFRSSVRCLMENDFLSIKLHVYVILKVKFQQKYIYMNILNS